MSQYKNILIVLLLVVAAGAFVVFFDRVWGPEVTPRTLEAKLCSDGSSVGRTGPNCEFAPCPEIKDTLSDAETGSWKTYTDTTSGISFRYPEDFSTSYIHVVDWPPKIQMLGDSFSCTEAGSEIARAGRTEMHTMNGHSYCVTKQSEGAAGSIYTQYAYAFPDGNGTAILTFTLRAVQCANYDDPKKTECENERAAFNPDGTLDRIAETITRGAAQTSTALATEYERLGTRYNLKYKTYGSAVAALRTLTPEDNIVPERIDFYVPGKVPREDGNPYFIFRTVVDAEKNDCLKGYMNLVSGAIESWHDVCIIYN